MNRVAIIQPGYMPWLGFFELMSSSDIFVIYDDVQFDKNGWRNRNRIKTPQGAQWLTVPVLTKGRDKPGNNEILIKGRYWEKKHLKAIKQNYARAGYFDDIFSILAECIEPGAGRLIDIDLRIITAVKEYLGIGAEILLSSSMGIQSDEKQTRIIDICRSLRATHYYNGEAGKKLYSGEDFKKNGIILEFQEYRHPVYRQLYGDFISHLSVIDLLFNEGKRSLGIINSGRNIT